MRMALVDSPNALVSIRLASAATGFNRQAMSSLTAALFRADDDAQATGDELAARGLSVARAPVTEIVWLAAALPPGPFDFAVATSARAFAAPPALAGLPIFVVGERTALAAQRAGWTAQSPADDVAALIPRLPHGRALYLAGRDRKPDLEQALAGRIAVVETYAAQTRAGWTPQEAQAVARAQAALHYSPRAAALAAAFAEAAGIGPAFLRLSHVCLSRDVAAPLAQAGAARVIWPQRPAEGPLLDALESALADRL
jgi:uroporphyrinogen-III synthase